MRLARSSESIIIADYNIIVYCWEEDSFRTASETEIKNIALLNSKTNFLTAKIIFYIACKQFGGFLRLAGLNKSGEW